MIKGKEGKVMSRYSTGGWDTKQVVYAQIAGKIKKVEEEIEYYENLNSKGNEDVTQDIVEGYKKQLIELKEAYVRAKKL